MWADKEKSQQPRLKDLYLIAITNPSNTQTGKKERFMQQSNEIVSSPA